MFFSNVFYHIFKTYFNCVLNLHSSVPFFLGTTKKAENLRFLLLVVV